MSANKSMAGFPINKRDLNHLSLLTALVTVLACDKILGFAYILVRRHDGGAVATAAATIAGQASTLSFVLPITIRSEEEQLQELPMEKPGVVVFRDWQCDSRLRSTGAGSELAAISSLRGVVSLIDNIPRSIIWTKR